MACSRIQGGVDGVHRKRSIPPVASSLRPVARLHSPSECSATWRGSGVKSGGYARVMYNVVRVFLRHHIWRFTLAPSRYSVETYTNASGAGSILFWVCFAAWMYRNYCETGSFRD